MRDVVLIGNESKVILPLKTETKFNIPRKQEQTEEESLLRDLETKNKHLKLTHGEISMKVKLFKDWYIQAIKTGKVRISS